MPCNLRLGKLQTNVENREKIGLNSNERLWFDFNETKLHL